MEGFGKNERRHYAESWPNNLFSLPDYLGPLHAHPHASGHRALAYV